MNATTSSTTSFYPPEIRMEARNLFSRGWSYKSVAEMIGLPETLVRDWGRQCRAGLFAVEAKSTKHISHSAIQAFFGYLAEGDSVNRACAKAGFSRRSARRFLDAKRQPQ